MSALVSGIDGGIVLSVFSSSIPGSFVADRIAPATAVLFTEPDITSTTSRKSSYKSSHRGSSCRRRRIPVTTNAKHAYSNPYTYTHPLIAVKTSISMRVSSFLSRWTRFKTKLYERLGLECLYPKLMRPFTPILKYTRCKLGIKEDEFLEAPPCYHNTCTNPQIEDQRITHDLGLPNLDFNIPGKVSTIDDCFRDVPKVNYGIRVRVKLIDDEDCDDYRYRSMCEELMTQNKVVYNNECSTQR